jgi:tRNA A-37 threonylcarbamoyl transferase component Bud32
MLPLSPSKLGRYEIVDEIGKGAMGVVYLARDPLIGRLVALKTFRISYSVKDAELEQFRARFIREAQSAGILSHPNIVTIHDVVERGDEGLAFIAMEYVRGTNLKSLLQEPQRQTLTFVCEILTQIADGLDYAHSCKVIHRDIKPANILITSDNRAKITDFGIARMDTSNLTQEGQLLGTPNYMSPEQILGRDVDHRADIFSLGVVLYEMVTRHKPFQGENLTVVSHRIVYDHFTPPKEYAEDLPPGTEQILAKALEKDPGRRYQRARDMADDLRRVLGSVGVRDTLNETQSLSTTAMLPAHLVRPAAPAPAAAAAAAPRALVPVADGGSVPGAVGSLAAPFAVAAGTAPADSPRPVMVGSEQHSQAGPSGSPAPSHPPSAPAAPVAAAAVGARGSLWRRLTGREGGAGKMPAVPLVVMPAPASPPAPGFASAASDHAVITGVFGAAATPAAAALPAAAAAEVAASAAPAAAMASTAPAEAAVAAAAAPRPNPRREPLPVPDAVLVYPHSTRPIALPQDLEPLPVPAAEAMPAPEAVPALAPPARPAGRGFFAMPSPARLAAAVAAGLGLGLLLAGGLLLWTRSGQPAAPLGASAARPEASQATRLQVLSLVRDGRRRLEAGDADGAAAAFRAAEQLLPGRRALRQLREEAELRQGDRRRRIDQERTIEAKLDEARLALADRRYPEAETAAQAVLAMSPGNTVAEEILASVKEGRARSKDRTAAAAARQQARTVAAAPPLVRPDAAPRTDQPAPASAVEAKDATLELGFFSAMPEGSLLIYINGRKVIGESFRFYEKGGLFRSRPSTGWVRRSFHLPAGNAEIRLYVTPHGSAAIVRTLSGSFAGGSSRRLDVKLTESGDVAAQLN